MVTEDVASKLEQCGIPEVFSNRWSSGTQARRNGTQLGTMFLMTISRIVATASWVKCTCRHTKERGRQAAEGGTTVFVSPRYDFPQGFPVAHPVAPLPSPQALEVLLERYPDFMAQPEFIQMATHNLGHSFLLGAGRIFCELMKLDGMAPASSSSFNLEDPLGGGWVGG